MAYRAYAEQQHAQCSHTRQHGVWHACNDAFSIARQAWTQWWTRTGFLSMGVTYFMQTETVQYRGYKSEIVHILLYIERFRHILERISAYKPFLPLAHSTYCVSFETLESEDACPIKVTAV